MLKSALCLQTRKGPNGETIQSLGPISSSVEEGKEPPKETSRKEASLLPQKIPDVVVAHDE